MIGRGVQDVVAAEIESDVSHALDARIIVALLVGKKEQVAAGDRAARHKAAPRDLCPRRHRQKDGCAAVEDVLDEGGAIVFCRVEAAQFFSAPVVIARRSVNVRRPEQVVPVSDDTLHRFGAILFDLISLRVPSVGADIGDLVSIFCAVPVSLRGEERHHISLVERAERPVFRARALADLQLVDLCADVDRVVCGRFRVLFRAIPGRSRIAFAGGRLRFGRIGGGACRWRSAFVVCLRLVILVRVVGRDVALPLERAGREQGDPDREDDRGQQHGKDAIGFVVHHAFTSKTYDNKNNTKNQCKNFSILRKIRICEVLCLA